MRPRLGRKDPYPAKVRFEGLPDLLPLGVATVCDDVDDGGFISSWVTKATCLRGGSVAQLPQHPPTDSSHQSLSG